MSLLPDDTAGSIREECVDNVATDVEIESQDEGVTHDPWDPEQSRIHAKTFSLH